MPATPSVPVVIMGAGGHAKVVLELFRACAEYSIVGFLDPLPARGDVLGTRIIGSDDLLPSLRQAGLAHGFVALGDNATRLAGAQRFAQHGFELVNAISPAAVISPTARLGRGVAIMAGAVVNADSTIADLAIINTRASVDHDGQIGEAAHIAPGCTLAGRVTVGRLAFIGTGSNAIPGVTVGENAVVGAGSCVVRNIPAGCLAYGVPARIVRPNAHAAPL